MKKEYPDILKLEGEKWHNPDPATGKLGTRVPAEWLQTTEDSLKSLTLEMLEVLKSAGINPNELNNTQVRDAIQKMILARVINYNDIQGRPVVKDSLGDDRNNPASQRVVNDVNRDVVTAQKTANTANDKANAAQTRADSAYNLANSKQDKLTFSGTGNVARMSEVNKKRDIDDLSFKNGLRVGAGRQSRFFTDSLGGFQIHANDKEDLSGAYYYFKPLNAGSLFNGIVTERMMPVSHIAENGWWRCQHTGFTIQTMNVNIQSGDITVNFPIKFDKFCASVAISVDGSSTNPSIYAVYARGITNTSFKLYNYGYGPKTATVTAFGY